MTRTGGLRTILRAGVGGVLFALSLTPPGPAAAESSLGYWSCTATGWHAVGWPDHPKPLIACGADPSGVAATTKELCDAAGGTWGPIGLFPQPLCVLPTIDAGRFCRDAGECAGTCLARPDETQSKLLWEGKAVVTGGYCSRVAPLVGCMAMVLQGRVDGMLCLD